MYKNSKDEEVEKDQDKNVQKFSAYIGQYRVTQLPGGRDTPDTV